MMKEKEKMIIEEAMKLFAKKGFAATSVQEIANEAGISKGSFYIYFKSKEELMISIFHYYFNQMQNKISSIEKEDLLPREKFEKQLYSQFDEFEKYKDFIIMHAREQSVPFNSEMEQLMHKMQAESFLLYKKGLLAIYGDRIKPFIWDMIVTLQGMFQAYLKIIIFDIALLDTKQIATFILNRADDFVTGLEKSDEPLVLSNEKMNKLLTTYSEMDSNVLLSKIEELKKQLSHHSDRENLYITLDVLKEEIQRDRPRIPVIQGMLANLSPFPDLKPFKEQVEVFYHIKKKSKEQT